MSRSELRKSANYLGIEEAQRAEKRYWEIS